MIKSQLSIVSVFVVLILVALPFVSQAQENKEVPICKENELQSQLSRANGKRREIENKLLQAEIKIEALEGAVKKCENAQKISYQKQKNAEIAAKKCNEAKVALEKGLQDCQRNKGVCDTDVAQCKDTIWSRDTTIVGLNKLVKNCEDKIDTISRALTVMKENRVINTFLVYRSNWWSRKKSYLIPVGRQEGQTMSIPGMSDTRLRKKKASRVMRIAVFCEIYDPYQGASIEPILSLSTLPTAKHRADTIETYIRLVFKRNEEKSISDLLTCFEAKAASDNLRKPSGAKVKSLKLKGLVNRRTKLIPNRDYELHIYDKDSALSEKISFHLD